MGEGVVARLRVAALLVGRLHGVSVVRGFLGSRCRYLCHLLFCHALHAQECCDESCLKGSEQHRDEPISAADLHMGAYLKGDL